MCIVIDKNTIQFSILEDRLNSFKRKYEELSFESFSRNFRFETGNKKIEEILSQTNPAPEETATPVQEIVATSEITQKK